VNREKIDEDKENRHSTNTRAARSSGVGNNGSNGSKENVPFGSSKTVTMNRRMPLRELPLNSFASKLETSDGPSSVEVLVWFIV